MAVLLGACVTRDPYVAAPATAPSGAWKIERQVDRITGAPVPSAVTVIDNAAACFLQEHRTVVIEDRAEIACFTAELADARNLLIRIRSLSSGRTTAEFKVEGAGAAIEAAFAGCPVAPPSEARKRAAS